MSGTPRYTMVVDTKKCVGCKACVLACKAENAIPDGYCRSWIVEEIRGEFPLLSAELRSERCNHCTDAPCVAACPTGASHYSDGGTVIVTRDKCTGCKACIASCPYDARFVHPEGFVEKCTFCLHRVRRGEQPACVEICPTQSLHFGDVNDRESEVAQLLAARASKVLHEEAGTNPNLYFLV
ncbi:MAG: tetrathionate reductase [Deltaproteobacteria bacterium CG2_30_63_29]|nr:MAG: tetrathionate reductase [Deltaproteobacteria bacterium CG2_30_63_29]PJB47936.1 MAG: tetrathionate reductase [Deltaproteobacteria bacterium CG_4_9_14_3_um_filter_63_12]